MEQGTKRKAEGGDDGSNDKRVKVRFLSTTAAPRTELMY